MLRKVLLICAGLVLALATASLITGHSRAAADECNKPSPMRFGRMGVIASGEDFACRVRVRAVKPEAAPPLKSGVAPSSVISIRSRVDRNDRTVFDTPAYVYFDLRPSEAAAWRNGKLKIVVYNSSRDKWESVDATQLSGPSGITRIGNRLNRFGMYGLAKTK